MVFVRCAVVMYTAFHLRKAVTIAVRYSAVRRKVCNYVITLLIAKTRKQIVRQLYMK